MNIRICIAVDTVDEALQVFAQLKGTKISTSTQVMVDPKKATDDARVFDPSHPPAEATATAATKPERLHNSAPAFGKNVSPKWVAAGRIGGDTKEALLKHIGDDEVGCLADVEHIAKKIKRTPDQTKALLQLLWDRGEIKYDGINFAKATK
jgi:hypothetical protein